MVEPKLKSTPPNSRTHALISELTTSQQIEENVHSRSKGKRQELSWKTRYVTFRETLNLQHASLIGIFKGTFLFLPYPYTLECDSCEFKCIAYPSVLVRLND